MNCKQYLPLAIAASAVVATQIGCTWVIVAHLIAIDPSNELSDVEEKISKIAEYAEDIAQKSYYIESNTEEMLMTPQERLQKHLEHIKEKMQQMQPRK